MRRVVLPLVAALALSGCVPDAVVQAGKALFSMSGSKVWLQKVKFDQTDDVNNNAPVTVDVVLFYDKALFGKVMKLTADDYFKKKEQLLKDYHSEEIEVFSFDVVPGQRMPDQNIEMSHMSGVGCIVFAHYTTPGAHRVVVGPDDAILIELGKLDFKVQVVKSEDN